MRYPTLSVVIPNYNHARFLPESLGAILAQSYRPTEVIILDDASTDKSVAVIEGFARQDPIVRLVRNEQNMGVEWNVNRLMELATGDYVYSPSADDKILPGFFEKSMSLLAQYPQAGLCSTVGRLMGENGEDRGIRSIAVISKRPLYVSPEEVRELLVKYGRWIDAGTVIYRRDVLNREGGYVVELGPFADQFANLVLALRYGACFVPEPLHCWRQMRSGYASRFAADWERSLENMNRAIRLMRSIYRELFPADYVDRFQRHRTYMVSVVAGKCAFLKAEETLKATFARLRPRPSLVDRAFWSITCAILAVQGYAWRLYSMARFGPWSWWILGRLSILRNLRRLVIRERLDA